MFQALRIRAKKAKASRKPHLTDMKPGIVIENVAQTRRLAETTLGTSTLLPSSGGGSSYLEEGPTCTGSNSQVRLSFHIVTLVVFILVLSIKKFSFLSHLFRIYSIVVRIIRVCYNLRLPFLVYCFSLILVEKWCHSFSCIYKSTRFPK